MDYQAYRERLSKVSGGDTDEYLYSPPVEVGTVVTITRMAAEDETLAFDYLRFFIDGHGYQHFLGEQRSPQAGVLYWDDEPVTLVPGERLGVKFNGTSSPDKLACYLTGYLHA